VRTLETLALTAFLVLLGAGEAAAQTTLRDADFRIRAGDHDDSTSGGLKLFCLGTRLDRSVSFQVLFPASAAYRTSAAANQLDWNKVMGITTLRIHHNSIRLGWRWLPSEDRMELGFYGYIRGRRIDQAIARVRLDEWVDVELRLHRGGLAVRVGSARYERAESLGLSSIFPTPTWILRTAYFGGDETAPHDMTVRVRSIRVR